MFFKFKDAKIQKIPKYKQLYLNFVENYRVSYVDADPYGCPKASGNSLRM